MILHQDNAPPHTASSTQLEIDVLGFQRLSHPPYSPDLAPMDFRVFPEVKSQLRGSHFDSGEELMAETLKIVSTFDPEFYDDIFQKWISRHRKCVATEGDYIEKV
jgi:[histone H3]-lysine36 N-dimethyltransferase SETMAR